MWWIFGAIAALYLVRRSTTAPAPAPASPAMTPESVATPVTSVSGAIPVNALGIKALPLPVRPVRISGAGATLIPVNPQRLLGVPEIAPETPEMGSHFLADEGGTSEFILKNPKHEEIVAVSTVSAGGAGFGGGGGGAGGGGGGAGGGSGHLK